MAENTEADGKAFKKASKRGRPTKLTEDIQKTICDAVRAGNYIETAAALAGISKDTLYQWMKKGARATTGKHKVFSDALKKAIAEAEHNDVQTLERHSKTHWQAAAWRLERKYPNRWGKKERVEVSGDKDAPLVVQVVWPEEDIPDREDVEGEDADGIGDVEW